MSGSADRLVVTDCGSTTTKAILFERNDGGWRLAARAEAPTTVEKPFEDVTIGVRNAVENLEEITGLRLSGSDRPVDVPGSAAAYLSTSSAGGGLQMLVSGLVRTMTGESAERAALGAGAIVMDVVAVDDGRRPHEKIRRLRRLRPDIVLLAGGTDGGDAVHVVEAAELLLSAAPQPRFGDTLRLPVIYAGNRDAAAEVERLLKDAFDVVVVDNIRPVIERENLGPVRSAVHEVFLRHVMSHAPGYGKLMDWTDLPILPTPRAVGDMIELVAARQHRNVMAVDIGGATTDVFSVFGGVFNRTVSANLGMSYSVGNVLKEAGILNVLRWLPSAADPASAREVLRNKMLRPTTIPQTMDDLHLEQAAAREALRLSLDHHGKLAVSLRGAQRERGMDEAFAGGEGGEDLVDMMKLDLLIGSGGVLSHAPRRSQAMHMLLDAFQPKGVTHLAVDSVFMLPHLGAWSRRDEDAAVSVLEKDCLVPLGACIAPVGRFRQGSECVRISAPRAPGGSMDLSVAWGEIKRVELPAASSIDVSIRPARGVDVGAGPGEPLQTALSGGAVGLVVDARGRPLVFPDDSPSSNRRAASALGALD
ncbi:MAG: glutamate mutase L [Planctomycetes bacterium]|nr:glutamate mutase L [Planctomycetota bacterium]